VDQIGELIFRGSRLQLIFSMPLGESKLYIVKKNLGFSSSCLFALYTLREKEVL